MKLKLYMILAGCLMLSGASLKAQKNVVKVNVLSPFALTCNLQYEHVVSAKSSLQLGFFYTYNRIAINYNRFGITPEYRFYLTEADAPAGVFIAPFLRYVSTVREDESADGEGKSNALGIGVILGKQWIFKRKMVLDMFFGPAYYAESNNVISELEDFEFEMFKEFEIRMGICLGVRF